MFAVVRNGCGVGNVQLVARLHGPMERDSFYAAVSRMCEAERGVVTSMLVVRRELERAGYTVRLVEDTLAVVREMVKLAE